MQKIITALMLTALVGQVNAMEDPLKTGVPPSKPHVVIQEEIEEINKALDENSSRLTEFAYQMQCMGDSYLHDKDYSEAAKCYVLSLIAVFDNHDLQRFFERKGIEINLIPDLSKKVLRGKDLDVLDTFLESAIANLK